MSNILESLKSECMGCRKCDIGGADISGMPSNVFSNMNCDAKVMVLGQNPGMEEVVRAEPFVGQSGKIFDEAMKTIGVSRKDLYISNTVKCYTPGNRKPKRFEVDNCRCFLDREIEAVKPVVIVALGGPAFKQMTGMNGITKHHGTVLFSPRYMVPVIPMLHPSPLNTNNPVKKEMFDEDVLALRLFLDSKKE